MNSLRAGKLFSTLHIHTKGMCFARSTLTTFITSRYNCLRARARPNPESKLGRPHTFSTVDHWAKPSHPTQMAYPAPARPPRPAPAPAPGRGTTEVTRRTEAAGAMVGRCVAPAVSVAQRIALATPHRKARIQRVRTSPGDSREGRAPSSGGITNVPAKRPAPLPPLAAVPTGTANVPSETPRAGRST